MSDDFMETIWAQFAVESEEHLEVMEQILVAAERSDVGADEVARLFRSFHSVKGLCKALDLLAMEKLAHRAEDLLGLVRDGNAVLDHLAAALLLKAVDALKLLHEKAVLERADGDVPEALLDRLAEAFVTAGGQLNSGADALISDLELQGAQLQVTNVKQAVLHEDPEMLAFFMDLVRENMAALTLLLQPECAVTTDCNELDRLRQTIEAAENISRAAEVMGFDQIKAVLDDIVSTISMSSDHITAEQHEEIVAHLVQFQQLIGFVEQESGNDVGSKTLASYLAESMRVNFDHVFEVLVNDLDSLASQSDDNANKGGDQVMVADEEVADSLQRSLSAANSYFRFLVPDSSCELLLLLEDVYARAARAELGLFTEIIELTREVLLMVQQTYFATVQGNAHELPDRSAQRTLLTTRINNYVWANESGQKGSNPVEVFRDFIKELKINLDLVEILSPENVRDLMAAVNDGLHLYEIMAHLESSEDVAQKFLTWVSQCGKVITNRSVFIDGQSWYELLLVSKVNHEEVQAALRAIDPQEKLIELKTSSGIVDLPELPPVRTFNAAPNAAAGSTANTSNVIRVAGETLDSFMNQIGEMVLVRAQLNYVINNKPALDALAMLKSLAGNSSGINRQLSDICDIFEAQGRKLAEVDVLIQSTLLRLQASAMALRVVPMETVFKRFPRVVRDLAQSQGKFIRLNQSGQEVKIDKAMVESLSDPLMHMVRNSADHGIESPAERKAAGKPEEAHILIHAQQQGGRVLIQVTDDGRGIDTEKVRKKAVERGLVKEEESQHLSHEAIYNFLFMPGFSTAETVTETSGRGVGMDVVRTNVMRLGGSINVKSEFGKGSTFTLEMPLSAAVQEVMLVNVAGQTLALPGRYVDEVVEIDSAEIQSIKGRQAVLLRGAFLPLVYMGDLLGFDRKQVLSELHHTSRYRTAVVVSNGQQMVGIEVDSMIGRRELFVKDIHPRLAALPGVGGASILGDGKVVLILDGEALLHLAENVRPNGFSTDDIVHQSAIPQVAITGLELV